MFHRIALALPLAAALFAVQAQEKAALKELSLKDAITKAYSDYSPDRLNSLVWIPGTEEFSYVKDDALMRGMVAKKSDVQVMTLAQLNAALPQGAEALKGLPEMQWTSPTAFLFEAGERLLSYDVKTGKCSPVLTFDAKAERQDLDDTQHHLAYTLGEDLYLATPGSDKQERITSDGADGIVSGRSVHREEYGITKGTFWSPNGNLLAFYRMDETMVTPYQLEDITSKPSTFKKIRYPMAGQTSHHVTLGVYDTRKKATVFLKTTGAVDDYLTNICWDPTEKYVFVIHLNRATDHLRVVQYDAATGEAVKTLIEEDDKKWLEPLEPLTFLKRAPTQFIYWSQRDGYRHLYLHDTGKGLVRPLTPGNWVVKRIIGLDAKETAVFVEGTGTIDPKDPKGAMDTHLFRIDLNTGKATQLTQTPGTHHGTLSQSGRYLMDTWSSLTVPGRTEVLDATKGAVMKVVQNSRDPLAGMNVGTVELVQLPGENGDVLNARIIKPRGFDSRQKYPVLVYLYNGPHVQLVTNSFLGGASLWMLHAAQRGYLVFTVDGHGSEDRGRDFEQVIHRQLGTVEVKDQLHGVEYLKSLPYVDGDRLAVHGWSFGGFMTTSLMLKAPGTFKVGVAGGPVMDWSMYEVMYTERYMDTPAENPDGYATALLTDKTQELK
ncbi:MAG TPA: DPP IV N-terminal domain-containing protein, partial [Flavobacteriales bacterium]|nr:DPP IV N-terminal domain-containing protein [Flavobacteriales bacterium]